MVVSILLDGYTTWTLIKCMEKRLDGNYTRMLQAVLNKSWRQHPTKQQLYGHQPPTKKTIKVRRTRHVWYCWISEDKLISDILLCNPSHERAKVGLPARTYIQQLGADTGYSLEDFPALTREGQGDPCWQRDMMIMIMICIKMDLALNNQRWLICHKTKKKKTSIGKNPIG